MLLPLLLLPLLAAATLLYGSTALTPAEVWAALTGGGGEEATYIVLHLRLPQMLTALLSGCALACSGLTMQSVFRNPLADPSLLGVNAGAGLGAAIAMLLLGGTWAASGIALTGFLLTTLSAFIGAVAVVALLMFFSAMMRGTLHLLVAGVMISFFASAIISILSFYTTAQGVRSYILWGLGDFSGVTTDRLPLFTGMILIALLALLLQTKPLNALLLGADYARNLGIRVRRARTLLLLTAGLLAATVTALCGPISFVGLAAPHIARFSGIGGNHRRLLPASLLWGSNVALAAHLIATLPGGPLPLNAVTALIGVPIVIWLLVRRT